jgi:hypothetical protein
VSEDSRTRFLVAIAGQLPAERVAEVHLFGSIRQGGTESGVAVLALELPPEPDVVSPADLVDSGQAVAEDAVAEPFLGRSSDTGAGGEAPLPDADASREAVDLVAPTPAVTQTVADTGHSVGEPTRAAPRYSVYSARYRHTLKGLDRGKWEVSVTEEALAPLLTIDAVVRGVQRRSGDADETTRLSGDEFRAALPKPPAVSASSGAGG